jgi:transcription antitermination factor NusG
LAKSIPLQADIIRPGVTECSGQEDSKRWLVKTNIIVGDLVRVFSGSHITGKGNIMARDNLPGAKVKGGRESDSF